ncbi:hypothetical protein HS121_02255 [bacterium]|nr:hypothetical protein [bacterium]
MPYNSDIHHRHSIRLREYDYSQAGAYFGTIRHRFANRPYNDTTRCRRANRPRECG